MGILSGSEKYFAFAVYTGSSGIYNIEDNLKNFHIQEKNQVDFYINRKNGEFSEESTAPTAATAEIIYLF